MEKVKSSIRSAHPTVNDLESAIDLLAKCVADFTRSASWVESLSRFVTPDAWTTKIEVALGNAVESENLRVAYREKSLHYMTGYVQRVKNRGAYIKARGDVLRALRAVIAAYDSIEERGQESWLRPILQGAFVAGDAEFTRQENLARDLHHDESDNLAMRAEEFVFTAFEELCQQSSSLARVLSNLPQSSTARRQHEVHPDRNVFVTPFDKTEALTVNFQLFELLQALEEVFRTASNAAKFLKEENGKVNERQHANRMIDVLFQQQKPTCGVLTDPAGAVQDQNDRRVQYQCSRQILQVAVREFKEQYEAVAAMFGDAAAEALLFCSRVHTERRQNRGVVIDDIIAYRCVMNNLLATELRLRRLAAELAEVTSIMHNDHTSGAGVAALSKQFETRAKIMRL